jgi:thiol-disulfide isomerase/thioredoxin
MHNKTQKLALCLLMLAGCQQAETNTQQVNAAESAAPAGNAAAALPENLLIRDEAGKAAPGAAFLDPEGKKVTLADFKGKPLLLNLWATWCAPCKAEMPQLDTLAAQNPGLQVLTVSQDRGEEAKKAVGAFFATSKFAQLKPYLDPETALTDAFAVESLPMTILYDANGKEVWRLIGPEEWTGKVAAGLIGEAGKKG